jgi:mannobiose 2-epimerase
LILAAAGCISSNDVKENLSIRAELEKSLRHELLDAWYPAAIDTVNGGFLSDFTYDWHPDMSGRQNKMIVTQTRHVWTTSQAARFFNDARYRRIAAHGFHFLKNKMWDETYGGFYWLRNREGASIHAAHGEDKSAYGNAFAIYALASYYAMSGDTSALHLAQRTFLWLDQHSRDPEYRGYIDRLTREGSWLSQSNTLMNARALAEAGWKDQNSSIHLLEAFTELYQVWPDSLVRARLLEMLTLVRDTIATERGYLTLFFEKDWTPGSFRDSSTAVREANYFFDHVSFGHDVETAYLMLEASHVLGLEADAKTLVVAKKMVDHALANGWDNNNGGFYYEGYYFANSDTIAIISEVKTWWVQAEGLNALLLMLSFSHRKKSMLMPLENNGRI